MKCKYFIIIALLMLASCTKKEQTKVIANCEYRNIEDSTQNTLSCLVKANELACFGLEFDVYITKDNALVVAYNTEIQGVDISNSFLSDIRNIEFPNGGRILTLEEFLKKAKDINIHLILKLNKMSNKKEVQSAEVISNMLKKNDLLDRTDLISLSMYACKQFLYFLPENDIYYISSNSNPEDVIYTPEQIKKIGLSGIGCESALLREHNDWIRESHKLGLKVNVRVIDKEEDMIYFINKGVDFITTNKPETAMKLLKK